MNISTINTILYTGVVNLKKSTLSTFFISILIISLLFSLYNYLALNQKYYNIQKQERDVLNTYLSKSISDAHKMDLTKVSSDNKDSVLLLTDMYNCISNSDAALDTTFKGDIEIIDSMYTDQYTMILRDILDKCVNGKLKTEDINNFKLLVENIEQLDKYVRENDKFNSKNFKTKVLPHLKSIKLPSN